ncbi:MAG TPA: hypothetical protein VFC63_28600, partial [Blastocatellia bacterium]|nr:hypothetical protein [Blastocatellia bacterium]
MDSSPEATVVTEDHQHTSNPPLVTSNTRLTRALGQLLFWIVILQFISALFFFGICVNWQIPTWIPYSAIRAIHFFVG